MLSVQNAEYVGDYKIFIKFNNGKAGTADLKNTIFNDHRPVFSMLLDKGKFKDFSIGHSTVIWSNELDIAPEYLFFLTFQDDREYREQFKQWGYIA